MIYGLQQERNFLCCTPNLRGYGERSHWPYKYHSPSTQSGWIFILFKKKMSLRSDLWYAQRAEPNNTFVFPASFLSQRNNKKNKIKKKHIYSYLDLKQKKKQKQSTSLKSSTSNRKEFGYLRPEAAESLHFIDKEQRGASEKQRRCSQVLGSMPYFRVVTFSLPPWLPCDTIPPDRQRWQIHVPMDQNPYFYLIVISQTSFSWDDLTRNSAPGSWWLIVYCLRRGNYRYYRIFEDNFSILEGRAFTEGVC